MTMHSLVRCVRIREITGVSITGELFELLEHNPSIFVRSIVLSLRSSI
jgi:hypothetical protein